MVPGGCAGSDASGYGGPGVSFSGINGARTSGTVNFSPAIAANGGTSWFSLEFPPSLNLLVAPRLSKSFGALSIPLGGVTTLTFVVANPNAATALTNVSFNDTLPAGLQVATPNGLTTTCGGTVTAAAGSTSVSLSGATLAGGASCTITVNVLGVAEGSAVNVSDPITAANAGTGNTATASLFVGPAFQIRYASNLTSGDSVIDISNNGVNGASLNGPGFGAAAGNICVNVYAFSPDEQLISCCSCLITPNGLVSLSVNLDLISNTLTGVRPNSVVVKLVGTATGVAQGQPAFTGTSCTNSAAGAGSPAAFPLAGGVHAWGTTLHGNASGTFSLTETPFSQGTLSAAELASITNRCTAIIGNGSTFGICRSCRQGGLGGARQ